jgi:hypothetical protein
MRAVPFEVLLVHLDLELHRPVDVAPVPGGDELEEQATGDGDALMRGRGTGLAGDAAR